MVRQWTHVLRQFTRLLAVSHIFYVNVNSDLGRLCLQRQFFTVQTAADREDLTDTVLGWVVHYTLCSLLPFTGPDALHHGRYGQKYSYALGSGSTCRFCW